MVDTMEQGNVENDFYDKKYLKPLCSLSSSSFPTEGCCNTNSIFLTNTGFANCTCTRFQVYKTEINEIQKCNETNTDCCCTTEILASKIIVGEQVVHAKESGEKCESMVFSNNTNFNKLKTENKEKNLGLPFRSNSCENSSDHNYKSDKRRVSMLVDDLLLKIYGERERKFSSCGTDICTFEGSTDSSVNIVNKSNILLKKKCSFSNVPEERCKKWNDIVRTRLMNKCEYRIFSYEFIIDSNTFSYITRL